MAVIRISGNHGAGKTTLGKHLAEHLGYKYHNTGHTFRRLAKEHGQTIEEFYASLEKNLDFEKQIAFADADLMKTTDNLVIDSRTMHLHETPFKVVNILLTVDPEVGAKRMHLKDPDKYPTTETALKLSRERFAQEFQRYSDRYGVTDFLDPKYFDIVLNTNLLSEEEVFQKVLEKIQPFLK